MPSRRHQRGVALLVAILLVALGTIIAATMAYNNAMTARRASATFEFDQALLVSEGAEALAAVALQQTAKESSQYIYRGQPWSQHLQPSEAAPGVTLEAQVEDLQGRFNINDLVGTDGKTPNTIAIRVFEQLLTLLNIDDPKLPYYIVDWIDANTTSMVPYGAEDSVYMEMDPPHRTPNLPISSTSELLAMPGITRAEFDKLAPHIVALPPGVAINSCTADPWVLDALLQGHVQWSADPAQFEKDREALGPCFPTTAQVLQAAGNVPGATPQAIAGLLSETSHWFRLTSFVDVGSAEFAVYTTLFFDQTGTHPVMRSFTPD